MPPSSELPRSEDPPDWALQEVVDQLEVATDPRVVTERARRLVREREDERHDEYDDPDQGGEG